MLKLVFKLVGRFQSGSLTISHRCTRRATSRMCPRRQRLLRLLRRAQVLSPPPLAAKHPTVRHRYTPSKSYDFQGSEKPRHCLTLRGLNGAARKALAPPAKFITAKPALEQGSQRLLYLTWPQVARGFGPFIPFGHPIRRTCKDHENMTCKINNKLTIEIIQNMNRKNNGNTEQLMDIIFPES